MALQFGVNLFPQQWEDVVRIEELGFDSAWTSEHIFFYFPHSTRCYDAGRHGCTEELYLAWARP